MSEFEDDTDFELGESPHPEETQDKASSADLKMAAEISEYLEYNLNVDLKRLRITVFGAIVHLQGSVPSLEMRKEIEERLPALPWVKGLQSHLRIIES